MLNLRSLPVRVLQKQRLPARANATASQVPVTESKWDILCGLCLERKPTILREMNAIERKFAQILSDIEYENSKKSEHEIRAEGDARRADMLKSGSQLDAKELDKSIGQTAYEFEDLSKKEAESFVPAARITEADKLNDVHSTDRKLDKHLTFIVNEQVGSSNVWMLPHAPVGKGETLRQAAERILREKCGHNLRARFYGNAPFGFYKYRYPLSVRQSTDSVGAKIFFMKAQYTQGTVDKEKAPEFNWATRTELSDKFVSSYDKAVQSFLIEDEEP